MRLRPRVAITIFCLISLIVSLIPPVEGNGWPEEQTRHIQVHPPVTGTDADMFVTEAGLGFSSSLVHVLDPNMDIYGYLFFSNIKLNSYFHLENATLRLHTASSMDFDADSSFTIYGIPDYRDSGMGTWGYGSPAEIMSAPLTTAHVTYNSSEFYGGQWWDIDVTDIVQELKSNPHYEGPGSDFLDPGENMAFIILGAEGHDTRYFYDASVGNGFEAQLHLHWDFTPPPPSGAPPTAEYVEDYGNFTIWFTPWGIEYVFTEGNTSPYDLMFDYIDSPGSPVTITENVYQASNALAQARSMVVTTDGTLYATYVKSSGASTQIYVKKSADGGVTWTDQIELSTVPEMTNRPQLEPSIAVDSSDNLHIIWRGSVAVADIYQIWYVTYTGSWSYPVRISTGALGGGVQSSPFIAVDSNDDLHAVWSGGTSVPDDAQIWYTKYDGSWSAPLRISTGTGMLTVTQRFPSIAIDSNDYPHVTWTGRASAPYTVYYQLWYVNNTGSWSTPLRLSDGPGMANSHHSYNSIVIDPYDYLHVLWSGANGSQEQMWYTKYVADWSDPLRISTATGMENYRQYGASLSVDSELRLYALWRGRATGHTVNETVWYTSYVSSWISPSPIQSVSEYTLPESRWSRWPIMMEVNGTYFVVDDNGTIVVDDLDGLDDAEDWIDNYDPDPEDPDPGGDWSEGPGGETGPLSRFRIRLYLLILGFGCVFGPVLFFSWRRPTGYYLTAGAIIMMVGLGLLMAIGDI